MGHFTSTYSGGIPSICDPVPDVRNFWPHGAALRFRLLETHSSYCKTTKQSTQFAILVSSLTKGVAIQVSDILIRPPTVKSHDDLKNAILRRLQPPTADSVSVIATSSCAVFIPTCGCSKEKQTSLLQGSNSSLILYWGSEIYVCRAISGVSRTNFVRNFHSEALWAPRVSGRCNASSNGWSATSTFIPTSDCSRPH